MNIGQLSKARDMSYSIWAPRSQANGWSSGNLISLGSETCWFMHVKSVHLALPRGLPLGWGEKVESGLDDVELKDLLPRWLVHRMISNYYYSIEAREIQS